MNAIRHFLLAIKGYRVREREGDEPRTKEGCFEEDANFIINEARLRFHDDIMREPKNKPRRLNILTTNTPEAEGPTIRSLTEPGPRPEPEEKLSLRERWRRLKAELNE